MSLFANIRTQSAEEKTNRGRIEIIADILNLCTSGSLKKTHLMQRANLSSSMADVYLQSLTKRNLLEEEDLMPRAGRAYRIGSKGWKFLHHYWHLRATLIEEE